MRRGLREVVRDLRKAMGEGFALVPPEIIHQKNPWMWPPRPERPGQKVPDYAKEIKYTGTANVGEPATGYGIKSDPLSSKELQWMKGQGESMGLNESLSEIFDNVEKVRDLIVGMADSGQTPEAVLPDLEQAVKGLDLVSKDIEATQDVMAQTVGKAEAVGDLVKYEGDYKGHDDKNFKKQTITGKVIKDLGDTVLVRMDQKKADWGDEMWRGFKQLAGNTVTDADRGYVDEFIKDQLQGLTEAVKSGWDRFLDYEGDTWDVPVETGLGKLTPEEEKAVTSLGYYGTPISKETIAGLKAGRRYVPQSEFSMTIEFPGERGSGPKFFKTKAELIKAANKMGGGEAREKADSWINDGGSRISIEGATYGEVFPEQFEKSGKSDDVFADIWDNMPIPDRTDHARALKATNPAHIASLKWSDLPQMWQTDIVKRLHETWGL